MALFTSDRERRLWTWTAIVVATIYSTLGLARTLSSILRDRGLFDLLFIIGFALLVVAVVLQALRSRPSLAMVGTAVGIGGVYAMVLARMGIPEERTHLFEYSLVAGLILQALTERRDNGGRVRWPAVLAVAVTAALGWVDEAIQAVLPNRVYDIRDVGFNALAGFMAVTGIVALGWVQRRVSARPGRPT